MSLTPDELKAEFVKIRDEAETEAVKVVGEVGQFLRSTFAALAKDPAVVAAVEDGFAGAVTTVLTAVETHGASILLPTLADAAEKLVVSAGGVAGSALVSIVQAELHAKVEDSTAATPEKVNAG